MRITRQILIPIFALAFLAILAVAAIPPPPVNQNFGIYDTTIMSPADPTGQTPIYNETMCRGCHNSTSSPLVTGGVPTRHHNLVATSAINPATNQPFGCQDCHPSTPGTGMGILLDRNCMDCHNATAFWGDSIGAHVGNFTRPHHNTTHAQARNCKFCHGASVDDYNDGHYIPSYNTSEVTPSALYGGGNGPNPGAFNSTSGRVWGGCLACHAEDTTPAIPIYFTHTIPSQINGKYSSAPVLGSVNNVDNNVHHNEILGITKIPGFSINDSEGLQCMWCHTNLLNVLDIRGCETCHSVRAIHNTQFDYANTSNLIGYGHIGSNNYSDVNNYSWDCKGCHAWYDAGDTNPFAGAIVPDVQSVTPTVFNANTPTVVTLTGTNFMQTNSTTVVNIDDSTNLTPDTITNGQITVTVNLAAGAHYIKVVKTDLIENVPKPSDIKPLTVVSAVTLSSATLNGGVLTISGAGMGIEPPTNPEQYVTFSDAGNMYHSDSVTSWNDNQIVAKVSGSIAAGDTVDVITTNSGEAMTTIVISAPTPTPTDTPTPTPAPTATPTPTPTPAPTATPTPTPTPTPKLTTITVSPSPVNVSRGGTQTFTATAKDQYNKPMQGIKISWSSSNTNVGTVSPTSATTGSNGQATTKFTAKYQRATTSVIAKNGAVSGSATVTVK